MIAVPSNSLQQLTPKQPFKCFEGNFRSGLPPGRILQGLINEDHMIIFDLKYIVCSKLSTSKRLSNLLLIAQLFYYASNRIHGILTASGEELL